MKLTLKIEEMKQKYMKLTFNGGRVLDMKWNIYLNNKSYYDNQQCKYEIYWK